MDEDGGDRPGIDDVGCVVLGYEPSGGSPVDVDVTALVAMEGDVGGFHVLGVEDRLGRKARFSTIRTQESRIIEVILSQSFQFLILDCESAFCHEGMYTIIRLKDDYRGWIHPTHAGSMLSDVGQWYILRWIE